MFMCRNTSDGSADFIKESASTNPTCYNLIRLDDHSSYNCLAGSRSPVLHINSLLHKIRRYVEVVNRSNKPQWRPLELGRFQCAEEDSLVYRQLIETQSTLSHCNYPTN